MVILAIIGGLVVTGVLIYLTLAFSFMHLMTDDYFISYIPISIIGYGLLVAGWWGWWTLVGSHIHIKIV